MNGEKSFKPQPSKGILDRRSSKVSADSFDVKIDKVVSRVFSGSVDNEPLYDSRSGSVADNQRKKYGEIKKMAEKEWLPEFMESFLGKIDILRQNGDLNLSPEEIKKRMSGIKISFFDQGSFAGKDFDALGVFGSNNIFAGIDSSGLKDTTALKKNLQHVFDHEMLHAISGSLFITTPKHLGLFNTQKQRTGLRFDSLGDTKIERFKWLNEAVTETLALDMDKDVERDSAPYKSERLLLSLLINGPAGGDGKHKVDKTNFFQAYFENYEPKDSDEIRLQYWKELTRSIGASYYSGFLVKIDKLIKEKGIGYVVSRFHILCEDKTSS